MPLAAKDRASVLREAAENATPRFSQLEDGLEELARRLAALETRSPEGPFTVAEEARLRVILAAHAGIIYVDQFAGNDTQKLASAINLHRQSALTVDGLRPTIMLPPRVLRTGRLPERYTNMHILGPHGSHGLLSMEQGGGHGINHRWEVAGTGTGDAAFLADRDDGANAFHMVMERIAFMALTGGQQWMNWQAGSAYSHLIKDCSFIGWKHVIGSPTAPSRSTALILAGEWNVHGGTDTQFTITGSDHNLWVGGWLNMQLSGGNGQYMMILDCDKTDVGSIFLTACERWRGVWIKSGCDELNIFGGRIEGKESGPACFGTLLRISGDANIFGTCFNFYMTQPGANNAASPDRGGIFQDAGNAYVIGAGVWPTPGPASSSDPSVIVKNPWYYLQGGRAEIRNVKGKGGFRPTVVHAGGTLIVDDTVNVIDVRP